ncbi:MAG: ADP-dependent NAD(P)H-hydrate dehydratase, partial [Rufibacter sp.]
VLLKKYSPVGVPMQVCAPFNSTGNPGMATGGTGDVLTGILTALRAQGYSPLETCLLGVYLHGLAGDLAAKKLGQTSLIASDIVDFLGAAFQEAERME